MRAFCSPGEKYRSFLLDEIFASHLFLLGHRNHCMEKRLKSGVWRRWGDGNGSLEHRNPWEP